jgi:hypothetical protein
MFFDQQHVFLDFLVEEHLPVFCSACSILPFVRDSCDNGVPLLPPRGIQM